VAWQRSFLLLMRGGAGQCRVLEGIVTIMGCFDGLLRRCRAAGLTTCGHRSLRVVGVGGRLSTAVIYALACDDHNNIIIRYVR